VVADVLEVLLADRPIGALTALNDDSSIFFSFDDVQAEDEARPTPGLSNDAHGRLIRDDRPV